MLPTSSLPLIGRLDVIANSLGAEHSRSSSQGYKMCMQSDYVYIYGICDNCVAQICRQALTQQTCYPHRHPLAILGGAHPGPRDPQPSPSLNISSVSGPIWVGGAPPPGWLLALRPPTGRGHMTQPSLSKVWHEHSRLKALLANVEDLKRLLMIDSTFHIHA